MFVVYEVVIMCCIDVSDMVNSLRRIASKSYGYDESQMKGYSDALGDVFEWFPSHDQFLESKNPIIPFT